VLAFQDMAESKLSLLFYDVHSLLLVLTTHLLSLLCSVTMGAGLHLRPTRESDHRASELRARWAAPPLDRAVGPTEPRLDRLAARRGIGRGILDGRQPRGRSRGLATVARARISHEAAWGGRDIVAAGVVCATPFCVRS
jgi:hypothetical protein